MEGLAYQLSQGARRERSTRATASAIKRLVDSTIRGLRMPCHESILCGIETTLPGTSPAPGRATSQSRQFESVAGGSRPKDIHLAEGLAGRERPCSSRSSHSCRVAGVQRGWGSAGRNAGISGAASFGEVPHVLREKRDLCAPRLTLRLAFHGSRTPLRQSFRRQMSSG